LKANTESENFGIDLMKDNPASDSAYAQEGLRFPDRVSLAGKPTRVLFALDTLNFGGTETQAVQIAVRLKAAGLEVTVACLHPGGPLTDTLRQAGIEIAEFPTHGSLVSARGIQQMLRLARFVRRGKFDVVHAHDLWANLMAVPAARLAGTPVILSSQRDLGHLWWYTPLRTRVIRAVHRLSTNVIANSAAVRTFVIEEFRVAAQRVQVLHNGVDFNRFANARGVREELLPGSRREDRLIAVVANMHSDIKGHHDLIEAATEVCRLHPHAKFVLIGDGQEQRRIEEHAKQAQVQDNFLFLGKRKDVPALLACCEFSVLASRAEGFPNAVLESMAVGLPVIATAVGGTPEIIEHGINGLLVPPKSPESLAQAILHLMTNHELACSIAKAGQMYVQSNFSFDRSVRQLQQIYCDAFARPYGHERGSRGDRASGIYRKFENL
jgi:glycosyltransferase involved in cell wall biosynthesis